MHDKLLRGSAFGVIVQFRKRHPGAFVSIDGQFLPFLQQMVSR
jgi:hypothetical protein